MAARDISSPNNNTGVPVDQFTEMSINNDKIAAATFDDIEDEVAEEYTVEKVLDHRINEKGKLQYLLKWEGWSSEYNSWENQENIFAEKLITKYWTKKDKLRSSTSLFKKEQTGPTFQKNFEGDCDDVESKKPGGNDKKRASSHSLDGNNPKKSCHHDINDSLCGNSTSSSAAENYKDQDSISFQDKEKQQEMQNLQSTTTQSTSSQVQQFYSPPSLQSIEPPWWNDLFDPEIRDPKVSLDWDKDSINVEFLELDDQGKMVGYVNWKSGSRSGHSLEELHAKCPQKMLEYYKENICFKLENTT